VEAEYRFGLQRRVGIVLVAASLILAAVNASLLALGYRRSPAEIVRDPSVYGLVLIAFFAAPTAGFNLGAARVMQVVIFLGTGLAMLIAQPEGSLGGLVFYLYSMLLAIRYGYFAKKRYLKFGIALTLVAFAAGTPAMHRPVISTVVGINVGLAVACFFYLYWAIFAEEIDRYKLESERLKREAISNQVFVRFGKNIAGIVHNVKSKLMSIEGFNDLIADGVAENREGTGDYATLQRRGIQQIHDMIDGLLLTVRSYQRIDAELFALGQLVRGAVEMLRANRDIRSGVRIDLDLCENDDIFASPLSVMQVLDALLQNAWEAMRSRDDRKIRVSTRIDHDFIVCSIEDRGEGLPFCTPCEYDNCLACPHFEIGRSSKSDGSGIGVAHARMLIRELGGRLKYKSTEGVGTTAEIWFPRPED